MLFARVSPALGAIDYSCEEGTNCIGDTAAMTATFIELQREVNRFLGAGLEKTVVMDGVIGEETVRAVQSVADTLNRGGVLVTLAAGGGNGSLLAAVRYPGAVSSGWIAWRAQLLLDELRRAATLLKRPIVLPATIVSAPPGTSRSRWPWILGGIGLLLAGTLVVVATRKKPAPMLRR